MTQLQFNAVKDRYQEQTQAMVKAVADTFPEGSEIRFEFIDGRFLTGHVRAVLYDGRVRIVNDKTQSTRIVHGTDNRLQLKDTHGKEKS